MKIFNAKLIIGITALYAVGNIPIILSLVDMQFQIALIAHYTMYGYIGVIIVIESLVTALVFLARSMGSK